MGTDRRLGLDLESMTILQWMLKIQDGRVEKIVVSHVGDNCRVPVNRN
jgi:hypothetical protein